MIEKALGNQAGAAREQVEQWLALAGDGLGERAGERIGRGHGDSTSSKPCSSASSTTDLSVNGGSPASIS